MKHAAIFAALLVAACSSNNVQPAPDVTVNEIIAEAAFAKDEIYGVRHRASGAVCPGSIDGVPRVRAQIVAETGPRFEWCQYTGRSFPQTFDIRIQRVPGETAEAGLAQLKAVDLKEPETYTETASDFPDRQAKGFIWSKPGSPSHGIWITRAGEWRVALYADFPDTRRDAILAAASDYFRKLRAR